LAKVVENKVKHLRTSKMVKKSIYGNMRVTKFSQREAERLELSLVKPTDQLFHQLANARLAERLLFAKPTTDISFSSLKQFYKVHTQYKSNISRMPSVGTKKNKQMAIKSWVD